MLHAANALQTQPKGRAAEPCVDMDGWPNCERAAPGSTESTVVPRIRTTSSGTYGLHCVCIWGLFAREGKPLWLKYKQAVQCVFMLPLGPYS
jgi:hypothetical protein